MSIEIAEHGGNLLSLPPCAKKRANLIHPPLSNFSKTKPAALFVIEPPVDVQNASLPTSNGFVFVLQFVSNRIALSLSKRKSQ